jgi:hypothetical protein
MAYFLVSLFISSFLLFQIQPLIGKYILPWFGSSPAVWSASLLFFQAFLTLGYAYSHGLRRRFSLRRQVKFHLLLLAICVLVLLIVASIWPAPILPAASFQPDGSSNPFWLVMRVLFFSVGFPYFLLATNSTLLQSWFSDLYPDRSPYRLYAFSNVASLLGLLSYPIFVERYLKDHRPGLLVVGIFLIYVISVSIIAWRVYKFTLKLVLRKMRSSRSASDRRKPKGRLPGI